MYVCTTTSVSARLVLTEEQQTNLTIDPAGEIKSNNLCLKSKESDVCQVQK